MSKTSTQKEITNREQNFQVLSETEDFQSEPRKNVIDNILNYSKALSVRKSAMIENVEMILN